MRWVGPKKTPASHARKIKTQSPQGHGQSPQGDREAGRATILPGSVPPGAPSMAKSSRSRSPQGHTSNIPWGQGSPQNGASLKTATSWYHPRPKFGDRAKAERTRRVSLRPADDYTQAEAPDDVPVRHVDDDHL
jgi:hypothetical protein